MAPERVAGVSAKGSGMSVSGGYGRKLLAMVLGAAGVAQAATVSYSDTFAGLTDVVDKVISVSQFDPALGTLQSALFVLSAQAEISAFAVNDGNFKAVWDIYRDRLSLVGSGELNALNVSASLAPTRVVGNGVASVATLSAFTSGQAITSSSPDEHYTGQGYTSSHTLVKFYQWDREGPALAASRSISLSAQAGLVGTGELDFLLNTDIQVGLSMSGLQTQGLPAPAWFGTRSDVVANVTVTYDFLPFTAPVADGGIGQVPEPAPFALLAGGLGLVGWRRRGKSGD